MSALDAAATGFFSGTAAAYTVAALAHLMHLFRREFAGFALWSTRLAWAVHTLALAFVVWHTRRIPVYSVFEALVLVSWLLATNYTLFELTQRNQAVGSVVVPILFILTVGALALPKDVLGQEELIAGHLTASLVVWHVVITLLGYGFFAASFVSAFLYLVQDYQLRRKWFTPAYSRLPSLETLDIWGHRFINVGFALLTLGLAAGLFFAELRWNTLGLGDPKVLWSLFTWVIYGGYLFVRGRGRWGSRRAAMWSLGGFLAIMVNLLVIGVFLSTLHRFGI